ncbi:NUMOD1 domain-containing DNA-binding protein [Phocaeicola sartorii]
MYSVETDEVIGSFDSITEAAKFIGCKASNITANINGCWKYKH